MSPIVYPLNEQQSEFIPAKLYLKYNLTMIGFV